MVFYTFQHCIVLKRSTANPYTHIGVIRAAPIQPLAAHVVLAHKHAKAKQVQPDCIYHGHSHGQQSVKVCLCSKSCMYTDLYADPVSVLCRSTINKALQNKDCEVGSTCLPSVAQQCFKLAL